VGERERGKERERERGKERERERGRERGGGDKERRVTEEEREKEGGSVCQNPKLKFFCVRPWQDVYLVYHVVRGRD